MKTRRWQRLQDLFHGAREQPREAWRPWLAERCADDPSLAAQAAALLEADARAGDKLERLAADGARATVAARASPSEQPGDRLGRYTLLRLLGEGGMSRVFLASRADDEYRQVVAVKLLKPGLDTEALMRRFRAERQILAGLVHPHIARLLDGGTTDDGRPYLVMEAIDGQPVDRYCDRHGAGIRERLELFRKVCLAVHAAHQRLVVHCDIKPGNILVTDRGEPRLLDFGIARLLAPGDAPEAEATQTTWWPLTPRYASPEQLGGRAITTATDVYTLGLVLHRLLTGHLPPRLDGDAVPPPPSSAVADAGRRRALRGDLDSIVAKALRREPEERYASAEQLADDLDRYLSGQPVRARGGSLRYRAGKLVRRYRLAVAAAVAFLVLVLGFGSAMTYQAHRLASESRRAQQERDRARQVERFLLGLFEMSRDEIAPASGVITARDLIGRSAEHIEDLTGQPLLQATLLATVGSVFLDLGLFDEAESRLRRAWELRSQASAPAEELAESLVSLGALERIRGHYDAAERHLRDALRLRPGVGDDAEVLRELAWLAWARGDYDRAEKLHQRALENYRGQGSMTETALRKLAVSLNDLAEVAKERADFTLAEEKYREALALLAERQRPEDRHVALVLANLGEALLQQRRLAEAEPTLRRALGLYRRELGDRHPRVAYVLNNLAAAELLLGRSAESEAMIREAIAINREAFGDDHLQLAEDHSFLARILRSRGDLEGARRAWSRSLEIGREVQPADYVGFSYPLTGLGRLALEAGDFAAAEAYLREAFELRRRALPEGNRLTGASALALAESLIPQGRGREAAELLRLALEGLVEGSDNSLRAAELLAGLENGR